MAGRFRMHQRAAKRAHRQFYAGARSHEAEEVTHPEDTGAPARHVMLGVVIGHHGGARADKAPRVQAHTGRGKEDAAVPKLTPHDLDGNRPISEALSSKSHGNVATRPGGLKHWQITPAIARPRARITTPHSRMRSVSWVVMSMQRVTSPMGTISKFLKRGGRAKRRHNLGSVGGHKSPARHDRPAPPRGWRPCRRRALDVCTIGFLWSAERPDLVARSRVDPNRQYAHRTAGVLALVGQGKRMTLRRTPRFRARGSDEVRHLSDVPALEPRNCARGDQDVHRKAQHLRPSNYLDPNAQGGLFAGSAFFKVALDDLDQ